MLLKKKVAGKTIGVPGGLAIGIMVSLLITVLSAALVAWLLSAQTIGEGTVNSLKMLTHGISAIVGSVTAYNLVKRMRLQVCLLCGACYYIILIGMTALLFGGQYRGLGVTALIVIAGSAIVAFWPTKK